MKIEFGIGSSKYSLECEKVSVNERLAMILYYRSKAPIVIYTEPKEVIHPHEFLKSKPETHEGYDATQVRKVFKSIKDEGIE